MLVKRWDFEATIFPLVIYIPDNSLSVKILMGTNFLTESGCSLIFFNSSINIYLNNVRGE